MYKSGGGGGGRLMTLYPYRFLENVLVSSRVAGALRKLSSKGVESKQAKKERIRISVLPPLVK